VRLALTIAALNDLEVKVSDVLNAYILHLLRKRFGLFLDQNLDLMQVEVLL